jgi:CheY-like chemotaxis protein
MPGTVAQLRHDLRTPVNLIVGYCEMLLEDARDAGDTSMVPPLTETLAIVREALTAINEGLPSDEEQPQERLTQMHSRLADTGRRVMAATAAVASGGHISSSAAGDLQRISEAAAQLVSVAAAAVPAPCATEPSEGGATDDGSAALPHVLVVDDLEANRDLLARRLRRQGCNVSVAESGRAALASLATGRFDLVLLDVMMPGMNGIEVLERMKASPALRDIPVLMVSALDDLDSVVRCIELGADDFLQKPFNPAILRARVSAALEKRRLRAAEADYLTAVRALCTAAGEAESGAFDPAALAGVSNRADELGRLSRMFVSMAEGFRNREGRLHAQLESLRAELRTASEGPDGPTTEMDLLVTGAVLGGRYEIETLLGAGGMGVVYRALDRELGERVALKIVRRELLNDETARARFREEIRLARRISHRNVVRTHDLGESDGNWFVTMECVEGVTLRRLLDSRGALAESAVVALGTQLARALEVAHSSGVVHRDIKPQNLLLSGDGTLKVMDFGIARVAEGATTLTQTGVVVGTPAYMAPEQLLGEEIDPRADLYSAGIVLYECLTARLPFTGTNPLAQIARMLHETPPAPIALRADVSPVLSGLVMKLLSRERDGRPSSAKSMAEALEGLS